MTIRLQVLLDEEELETFRQTAEAQRMTLSEWVRRALRLAIQVAPRATQATVLVREAAATRYKVDTGAASALERLELALHDLDGEDADAAAAWEEEIARRLAALHAGTTPLRDWADVLTAVDRRLAR